MSDRKQEFLDEIETLRASAKNQSSLFDMHVEALENILGQVEIQDVIDDPDPTVAKIEDALNSIIGLDYTMAGTLYPQWVHKVRHAIKNLHLETEIAKAGSYMREVLEKPGAEKCISVCRSMQVTIKKTMERRGTVQASLVSAQAKIHAEKCGACEKCGA